MKATLNFGHVCRFCSLFLRFQRLSSSEESLVAWATKRGGRRDTQLLQFAPNYGVECHSLEEPRERRRMASALGASAGILEKAARKGASFPLLIHVRRIRNAERTKLFFRFASIMFLSFHSYPTKGWMEDSMHFLLCPSDRQRGRVGPGPSFHATY